MSVKPKRRPQSPEFQRLPFLLLLPLVVISLAAFDSARAALLISEMLADPASDWNGDGDVHFRDDEWIEITNTGTESVDLGAYYLRDALGDEPQMNLSGSLAPRGVVVFYGSDAVAWQQANGVGVTGFSLNNGGDTVELLREVAGETELVRVDIYIYVDHEAEDDRASGRLPVTEEWALFDQLNPYDGDTPPWGTGCSPTPGVLNDCVPNVPNESATWGHLKVDYH
jgi:hypothetical protein